MIQRRAFIINGGLALGALALVPTLAFDSKTKNIGLQLYTLREALPKDVKGTIEKIAKAGYTEVETYGFSTKDAFFGTSVKDFKSILSDNGLKATSGHYDFNTYIKNGNTDFLKASIETANSLGSEYVVVPWLDEPLRQSIDDYKKIALKVNEAGVLCKKAGLKIAYHNHDFEFKDYDGRNGYDILLKETDKNLVNFEMDLYWVVRSGNDPLKLFKEHPERFTMWHVKDLDKSNPEWNTEIGEGTINFKSIFAEAKLSGMKRFFVEQETNYSPSPIGSIETSYSYIKNNLI